MILFILSLFYTPHELGSQGTAASETVCIQGISYESPTQWRVWLNGQQIAASKATRYHIISVSSSHVCFEKDYLSSCLPVGACTVGKSISQE